MQSRLRLHLLWFQQRHTFHLTLCMRYSSVAGLLHFVFLPLHLLDTMEQELVFYGSLEEIG
jgi:hypothetical protein